VMVRLLMVLLFEFGDRAFVGVSLLAIAGWQSMLG